MRRARAVLFIAILALGLMACQAMFTTSLGTAFERTTITIPADISAADAQAILDNPSTSPAAYSALLDVLNAQAATSTASAGLAVDAAIGASGMAENLAQSLMDAAVAASPDIPALVTALQDISGNAAAMAAFARLDAGAGAIDPAVLAAADLSPTDMALVALVVVAAPPVLPAGQDPTDAAWLATGPGLAFQASPQYELATNLLTQAANDIIASGGDSAMADALKSALGLP